jgi:hypothetical protein
MTEISTALSLDQPPEFPLDSRRQRRKFQSE